MATTIALVETDAQIDALAGLAASLFEEYYPDIESQAPSDVSAQPISPESIKAHMANDSFEYYFVVDDAKAEGEQVLGLLGMKPDVANTLSGRLYISKANRGQGHAGQVFTILEGACGERDIDAIWLQVNKNNKPAIDVYKMKTSGTARQQSNPVEGFVFDEFLMEQPAE